ncbi:hypothetical protein E2C01_010181 [Portunus trituberculatus]|uniref:Uncharacterized protein n=1 Tax=Portunus trituberculatus TaxID=210409 RepID=A0A5B7D7P5_PORTR|nr:hypothetical protein [Portunus trituberculatus]
MAKCLRLYVVGFEPMRGRLPDPTLTTLPTTPPSPYITAAAVLHLVSEEEILAMCPSSVQKVTRMRNSSNMVLLTFFWFHPP